MSTYLCAVHPMYSGKHVFKRKLAGDAGYRGSVSLVKAK